MRFWEDLERFYAIFMHFQEFRWILIDFGRSGRVPGEVLGRFWCFLKGFESSFLALGWFRMVLCGSNKDLNNFILDFTRMLEGPGSNMPKPAAGFRRPLEFEGGKEVRVKV